MEQALNIAPNIIIIAIMLVQSVVAVVIVATLGQKMAAVQAQVTSFVTPVSEGQPSPLATTTEVAADMVARAIVARAKTTFMGQASGLVRQEKAVDADIAEDVARSNPLIDSVLSAFPAVRKTLRKNPMLLDMVLSKVGEMQAKSQQGANGSANTSPSPSKISS